jgi:hypothetical protein
MAGRAKCLSRANALGKHQTDLGDYLVVQGPVERYLVLTDQLAAASSLGKLGAVSSLLEQLLRLPTYPHTQQ